MHSDALMEVLAALGGGGGAGSHGSGSGAPVDTLYGLVGSTARAPCVPLLFRITQLAGSQDSFLKRVALKSDEPFAATQFRACKDLAEGFVADNLHRVGTHHYCLLDGSHFGSEALAVAHFKAEHADAMVAFLQDVLKDCERERMGGYFTKLLYSPALYPSPDAAAAVAPDVLFPSAPAKPLDRPGGAAAADGSGSGAGGGAGAKRKKKKKKKKRNAANKSAADDDGGGGEDVASAVAAVVPAPTMRLAPPEAPLSRHASVVSPGRAERSADLAVATAVAAAQHAEAAAAAPALSALPPTKSGAGVAVPLLPVVALRNAAFSDTDLVRIWPHLEAPALQGAPAAGPAAPAAAPAAAAARPDAGKRTKVEQPRPRRRGTQPEPVTAAPTDSKPKDAPAGAAGGAAQQPPPPSPKTPSEVATLASAPVAAVAPAVVVVADVADQVVEAASPLTRRWGAHGRDVVHALADDMADELLADVLEGLVSTLGRRAHQQHCKEVALQREAEEQQQRKQRELALQAERVRAAEARRVRKLARAAESSRWAAVLLDEVVAEESGAIVRAAVAEARASLQDHFGTAGNAGMAAASAASWSSLARPPMTPFYDSAPYNAAAAAALSAGTGGPGKPAYIMSTQDGLPLPVFAGLSFPMQMAATGYGTPGSGAALPLGSPLGGLGNIVEFVPGATSPGGAGGAALPPLTALLSKAPMPAARVIKCAPEECGLLSRSTIEIHNLPRNVTEGEVAQLFGIVSKVVLLRGPDAGCAFVELPSADLVDTVVARKYSLRGAAVLVQRPRIAVLTSGSGQAFKLAPGAKGLLGVTAAGVSATSPPASSPVPLGDGAPLDDPDHLSAASSLSYLLADEDALPNTLFGTLFGDEVAPPPGFDAPLSSGVGGGGGGGGGNAVGSGAGVVGAGGVPFGIVAGGGGVGGIAFGSPGGSVSAPAFNTASAFGGGSFGGSLWGPFQSTGSSNTSSPSGTK